MKKIVDLILYNFIGKKGYHRFFLALKNIGLQGLNYRNTNIDLNGEHYFIKRVAEYYKKINQSAIIFDVGANIGNYAKVLKNTFKQNCHIFAFEPFSAPFIQLLQLKDHTLTPENLGLSNVNETLTVYTSNEFSEIGGVYNRDYLFKDIPHDKEERSSFVTLDFYCKKHKLDKINFLKIDVEGHEYAVLEGAKNLLEQGAIEFIQFEFGAGNHFSKTYFIDFHSLLCRKYKIYRLLKNDIIEVKDYNSDFEMLILTNFICIKNEIVKNFDITKANSFFRKTKNLKKDCEIISIGLFNQQNRLSSDFLSSEDISVEIIWENRNGLPTTPNLELHNLFGLKIFWTTDSVIDFNGSKKSNQGTYKSTMTIPKNLLNNGEYLMHVGLDLGSPRANYDCVINELFFIIKDSLNEPSLAKGNFNFDSNEYALLPAFTWKYELLC